MTSSFGTATRTQSEGAAQIQATALGASPGAAAPDPLMDLMGPIPGAELRSGGEVAAVLKSELGETAPSMSAEQAQERLNAMEQVYSDIPAGVQMYEVPEGAGGSIIQDTAGLAVKSALLGSSIASYSAGAAMVPGTAGNSAMLMQESLGKSLNPAGDVFRDYGRMINEHKYTVSGDQMKSGLSRTNEATKNAAKLVKNEGVKAATKQGAKSAASGTAKVAASTAKQVGSKVVEQTAKSGALAASRAGAVGAAKAGSRIAGKALATVVGFPVGTIVGTALLVTDPLIVGAVRKGVSYLQGHRTPSLESEPSWDEGLHYLTLTRHEARDEVIRAQDGEIHAANLGAFNFSDRLIWHPTNPDILTTSDFGSFFELFGNVTELIRAAGEETLGVLMKYQEDPYINTLTSNRSKFIASMADASGMYMNPIAEAVADPVVAYSAAYAGLRDVIYTTRYGITESNEPDTALWGMVANPFYSIDLSEADIGDAAAMLRNAVNDMEAANEALAVAGTDWVIPVPVESVTAAGLTANDMRAVEEFSQDPSGYVEKLSGEVSGAGEFDAPEVPDFAAPDLPRIGGGLGGFTAPSAGGFGGFTAPSVGGLGGVTAPGSAGLSGLSGAGAGTGSGLPGVGSAGSGSGSAPKLDISSVKTPDGAGTVSGLTVPKSSGAGSLPGVSAGAGDVKVPDFEAPKLTSPDVGTVVSGAGPGAATGPGSGLGNLTPVTDPGVKNPMSPGKLDPTDPKSPLAGGNLGSALKDPAKAPGAPGTVRPPTSPSSAGSSPTVPKVSVPKNDRDDQGRVPKVDAPDIGEGQAPSTPTVTSPPPSAPVSSPSMPSAPGGGGGFTVAGGAPGGVPGGGFAAPAMGTAPSGFGGATVEAGIGGIGGDGPGGTGSTDGPGDGPGDATGDGEIDPNDPASNPENDGIDEPVREPTAITRDGQTYEMTDTKAAKMAELLNPADGTPGKDLRIAASEAGFKVPPSGFDIGSPISPADIRPGDVVVGDGIEGVYVGDGLVLTKEGLLPLSEVAVFNGANQGIYRLDGNMVAEDSLATGQGVTAAESFDGGAGSGAGETKAGTVPGGMGGLGGLGAGNPNRANTAPKSAGGTGDPFDPVNNNSSSGPDFGSLKVTGTGGIGASPFGGNAPRVPVGD